MAKAADERSRVDFLRYLQAESMPCMAQPEEGESITNDALLAETMRRTLRTAPMRQCADRAVYMTWSLWHTPPHTACDVLLDEPYCYRNSILLRTRNIWVNDLIQLLQSGTERQTAYFFVGHTHTDHALVPSLEDLRTDAILQKYTGSAQFLESYITNGALDYVQVQ